MDRSAKRVANEPTVATDSAAPGRYTMWSADVSDCFVVGSYRCNLRNNRPQWNPDCTRPELFWCQEEATTATIRLRRKTNEAAGNNLSEKRPRPPIIHNMMRRAHDATSNGPHCQCGD
eukprot:6194004-Amphidinium_carterae.1